MNPTEAIVKLKGAGLTEAAIAVRVDAQQSTINRIARDKMQPNWALGNRLIVLASRTRKRGS